MATLYSPDGLVVAQGYPPLSTEVTPGLVQKSRGPSGEVKRWRLSVANVAGAGGVLQADIEKTVLVPKNLFSDRIQYLFGKNGANMTLALKRSPHSQKKFAVTAQLRSPLAETLTVHGLAGLLRTSNPQSDPLNIEIGREYVLYEFADSIEAGPFTFYIEGQLNVAGYSIELTRSVERSMLRPKNSGPTGVEMEKVVLIPADLPLVRLNVKTTGSIQFTKGGITVGTISRPQFSVEIAIEIDKIAGRPVVRCWIDTDSVSIFPPTLGLAVSISAIAREMAASFSKRIAGTVGDVFDHLLGGAFDFKALTTHPDAFLSLTYRPAKEPERSPNVGYRAFGNLGIDIFGRQLGMPVNTWQSPNLDKIQHIVVLMMENRSFDHVLGYLSMAGRQDVNGLSPEILARFNKPGAVIQPMANAGFLRRPGSSVTRLPLPVGHTSEDVAEQLAIKGGIATMTGFVSNFKSINTRASPTNLELTGCLPQDVLGYYTGTELPVYDYLAKEFGICDNYYCSHPGPTLPNRMFYLTGDFQKNRNGEPRMSNGVEASFYLNRDRTIFDVLNEGGIPWRVYESSPSVATLRLFSRYAFDEVNIRDIARLSNDIKNGDLPPVTYLEPAMHSEPINDDHPPADMKNGQNLVLSVVNALRGNKQVWDKTLLIVTYDEHGGLFDHVPPPVAETMVDPRMIYDARSASGLGPVPGKKYRPNESVCFGVRVPTFLVSPWVPKGSVHNGLFDHSSILKTILVKHLAAKKPFMSDRVHAAHDLGKALTLATPRTVSPMALRGAKLAPTAKAKQVWGATPVRLTTSMSAPDSDFHEVMAMMSKALGR